MTAIHPGRCSCGHLPKDLSREQRERARRARQVLDDLPDLARRHRLSLGLGLRGAARQIGVSASTLGRLENGRGFVDGTATAVLDWIVGGAS